MVMHLRVSQHRRSLCAGHVRLRGARSCCGRALLPVWPVGGRLQLRHDGFVIPLELLLLLHPLLLLPPVPMRRRGLLHLVAETSVASRASVTWVGGLLLLPRERCGTACCPGLRGGHAGVLLGGEGHRPHLKLPPVQYSVPVHIHLSKDLLGTDAARETERHLPEGGV